MSQTKLGGAFSLSFQQVQNTNKARIAGRRPLTAHCRCLASASRVTGSRVHPANSKTMVSLSRRLSRPISSPPRTGLHSLRHSCASMMPRCADALSVLLGNFRSGKQDEQVTEDSPFACRNGHYALEVYSKDVLIWRAPTVSPIRGRAPQAIMPAYSVDEGMRRWNEVLLLY